MVTDSIMSLITLVLLLAATSINLSRSQETEISLKDLTAGITQAPLKLDKNLRRALLKALTDLEAESAERHKEEAAASLQQDEATFERFSEKTTNTDPDTQNAAFSFKGFPGEEDLPTEDKLQNSSFVEAFRYVTLKSPEMNIEKATQDDARSFHVQNVILPEVVPKFGAKTEPKQEEKLMQRSETGVNSFSVSKVESLTLNPATEISESLARSASTGLAAANALVAPKPTVSTPTIASNNNVNLTISSEAKDKTEEVKIFQAPLVAAFTVQQDELGVPKSVVPIFRSPTDSQALTLQEQLEFKQKLLEKQLAELQQQQIEQTQFLVRQQQLYEQQLRQKQQQQYYLQEQARIKQFEEQAKLKRLEEQRYKQLEEQRLHRFQPQRPQKQHFFEQQSNNIIPLQPAADSNVLLQPSLTLEVPNAVPPTTFQPTFHEHLRLQSFRQPQPQQLQPLHQQQQLQQPQQLHQQQQLQQPQQLHQHPSIHQTQQLHQPQHLHQLQQQQRLQQSFGSFSDFQPSLTPTTRFNRQEAFNAVGNFGFNADNKVTHNRNRFEFSAPQRNSASFYNPYTQYRQTKPPTPARQIQNLLFQSGIANDLGTVQGTGNHEDLNIVSKVLALNVGALTNKNLQYDTNNRASGSFGKATA